MAEESTPSEPALIHLVGPFRVVRGGRPLQEHEVGSRKGRRLLKLLAARRGRAVPADEIAETLWGDPPPPRFEQNVASLVSRLRGVLGAAAIRGDRHGYRLLLEAVDVDVDRAARLTSESRGRLSGAEPALALAAARRASALLAGEVLEGEPDAIWVDDAREEARRILRDARGAAWRAAFEVGDVDAAREAATAAAAADPLDEEAARALMTAHRRAGNDAASLAAYERLRSALGDELGADPSPETQELHLALLRGEPAAPDRSTSAAGTESHPGDAAFVGRDAETAELTSVWTEAAGRRPSLVLLVGEAGIGKSRLAEEAVRLAAGTGGLVARARCFEAERSLFLQPVADALRSIALSLPPDGLRRAVGEEAGALALVVPEVAAILRPHGYQPADAEIERRRSFDAVRSFLVALGEQAPVLLFLDDLQNAGSSTLELLHFLARRASGARLAILATVRIEEGDEVLEHLGEVGRRIEVGQLSAEAVDDLARRMGAERHAGRLMAATRGHTLSVVEILRAMSEGEAAEDAGDGPEVPPSLAEAVLNRVRRTGPDVEDLLRVAAVLGSTFGPADAASMLDVPVEEAVRRIEVARRGRLVVVAGDSYSFANDLIQEILYRDTPAPALAARHRRAASLSAANPEAVARHATAAGDWDVALDAWLAAGRRAAGRFANLDARRMFDRALEAAEAAGDRHGEAVARLERGRVLEALVDLPSAYHDHEAALVGARDTGDRRLEMLVLRELGGDPLLGLGRPSAECVPYLEEALVIASEIGDGRAETDILTRLAVLSVNRLRFGDARDQARRAVRIARGLDDDDALVNALDGLKGVAAYDGNLDELERVTPELERLARRTGRLMLLQWAVFESAFVPMARGRWPAAIERIRAALELNRRVGYYALTSMFLAHVGWIHRSRGRYAQAATVGRQALFHSEASDHPWWHAFSASMLGWTLTETGRIDEAARVLETGLERAERDGAEAYTVRCRAHLALALATAGGTDAAAGHLREAERILADALHPPESNFLHGAHAAIAASRAAVLLGSPERAEALAKPVLRAAEALGWVEPRAEAALVLATCRLAAGDPNGAEPLAAAAAATADASGLLRLTWEARAIHAGVLEALGEAGRAAGLRSSSIEAATAVAEGMDPADSEAFLARARAAQSTSEISSAARAAAPGSTGR